MPTPTLRVEIDDSALQRVIAAGTKLGVTAAFRLRQTFTAIGLHVEGRAGERAPVGETGTLSGAGHTETHNGPGGLATTITFGGMASKYAEVQHERDDYTHTREAWVAKYGTAVGARSSLRTGRTSYRTATGKTLKLKGHKGGQAHFLWGNENSAWNPETEAWASAQLEAQLPRIAGEVLDGG